MNMRSFDMELLARSLTRGGHKVPGQTRVAVDEDELEAFKFSLGQPGYD